MTCRVCLGPHDAAIHAATLHVRRWLRFCLLRPVDKPVAFAGMLSPREQFIRSGKAGARKARRANRA
jgi:hypothetical protein